MNDRLYEVYIMYASGRQAYGVFDTILNAAQMVGQHAHDPQDSPVKSYWIIQSGTVVYHAEGK